MTFPLESIPSIGLEAVRVEDNVVGLLQLPPLERWLATTLLFSTQAAVILPLESITRLGEDTSNVGDVETCTGDCQITLLKAAFVNHMNNMKDNIFFIQANSKN